MQSARIVLSGLRAMGRHGASPGERLQAQEFVIDIDASVDVAEDSLDATVDYREIARAAVETVESTSFELLETLADAVARAVYQYSGISRATVVLHKPEAAKSIGADDVSAEATIS